MARIFAHRIKSPLFLTFIILLLFAANPVMAQTKYKVVVPEGWEAIPAEAATGDRVIVRYVGTKKVLDVQVHKIISLDKTNMSVTIGNTDQLTATTCPENQTVTWSSSNESVATVDEDGVVTGVAIGTATITATYDGSSESCEVTVKNSYLLPGEFSVSSTKKVRFAKGNLQYHCQNGTWQFAAHQYDYIGNDNLNISETYNGWIDLFGWGTWTQNGTDPWKSGTDSQQFKTGVSNCSGDFDNVCKDGIGSEWKTLSINEWFYLISVDASDGDESFIDGRNDTRADKYGLGSITVGGNTINGLVLLPDNWTYPTNLSSSSSQSFKSFIVAQSVYTDNTYTADDWEEMEKAGAVFFPVAGFRDELGSGGSGV